VSNSGRSEEWWFDQIISILKTKDPDALNLTGSSTLSEAVDDSLEMVELIMVFEDEFDLSIPEGRISQSMTLRDLARLCAQVDRDS